MIKKFTNDVRWYDQLTYNTLPKVFYQEIMPSKAPNPQLIVLNEDLLDYWGLPRKDEFDYEKHFSGNDDTYQSIAQNYAGHQFGHFTYLGDGRAHVLGEFIGWKKRYDVQLKGSGSTNYSRRGDGKATLSAMLREYLMSEAMHALGIPTTRSLAVLLTGETVQRETPLPGAILARVASSHIRVGTFQLSKQQTEQEHKTFVDYVIQRHDPVCFKAGNPYICFLSRVIDRQAKLIAKWQLVGFVHGVMNTDNMVISGETIDYGPCAFMDEYNIDTCFSSIDRMGRYSYKNQPEIAQWNLARFAETLLPFINPDKDEAIAIALKLLNDFKQEYEEYYYQGMKEKLGLRLEDDSDKDLIDTMLELMETNRIDYTNHFVNLTYQEQTSDYESTDWKEWFKSYHIRLQKEKHPYDLMRKVNPRVIPRNHLVDFALKQATNGDFKPFTELLEIVQHPFEDLERHAEYYEPNPNEEPFVTYCGT